MGSLGKDRARFRDGIGPIILGTVTQRLFEHALLQVIQLLPGIGVLLDRGKEPSVELRVSIFDEAGEVTPVRLGPGVLDQKDNSHSDS